MIRRTLSVCTLAAVSAVSSVEAAPTITLIDEDFQTDPLWPNDTHIYNSSPNSPIFPGWYSSNNRTQRINTVLSTHGIPQGGESGLNQGVQFEYQLPHQGGTYLANDTGHTWSEGDVYTLSLNATEQNWNNQLDRYVAFRIRETGGSIIYTGASQALPEYDPNHNGAGDDWNANQFFSWSFSASDFAGGTEGSPITLEIYQPDEDNDIRGMFIDNVLLTVVVPEPATGAMALVGLGVLASRRRRA